MASSIAVRGLLWIVPLAYRHPLHKFIMLITVQCIEVSMYTNGEI